LEEKISLINKTKTNLPVSKLVFVNIKNDVLGKDYDLSLVFVGNKLSQKINKENREKDYPANVLSFPLDKNLGEIFINLENAKEECVDFNMDYENFIVYLFIHGLLHLKGMDHSSKMDSEERKICKKFNIS